ncbi:hypothetical protein PHLCEN_2v9591 [Hermanssonia centrifuga]|uniref:Uncharacterized protein n=1 Tax=Hermanssonia centrifuga TaxID=98765 RepID=A0A2R6NQ90_9APHY|nr:hypothetical protein PHLCEN_2v9591 [Hermanssonia centrifuga]
MHIGGSFPQEISDVLDVLGCFSRIDNLSMQHIDSETPDINDVGNLSSMLVSTFCVKSLSMSSFVAGIGSYLDVLDRIQAIQTLERLDVECLPLDAMYLRTLSRIITNGGSNIEELSLRFSDIKDYTVASRNLSDLVSPTLLSLTSLQSFTIYLSLNVSAVSADVSIWTIIVDLISALPTATRHITIAIQDGVSPLWRITWKTIFEGMNGSALRMGLQRLTELEVVRFVHISSGKPDLRGVSIVERALPELVGRDILRFEQRDAKEQFNAW